MGTFLKERICSQTERIFSHYEQFLIAWKITFITLSDLPWMLLFLLWTCVTGVMGATPVGRASHFIFSSSFSTWALLSTWALMLDPLVSDDFQMAARVVNGTLHQHDLDRIQAEVNQALDQKYNTWVPSDALIVTWKQSDGAVTVRIVYYKTLYKCHPQVR